VDLAKKENEEAHQIGKADATITNRNDHNGEMKNPVAVSAHGKNLIAVDLVKKENEETRRIGKADAIVTNRNDRDGKMKNPVVVSDPGKNPIAVDLVKKENEEARRIGKADATVTSRNDRILKKKDHVEVRKQKVKITEKNLTAMRKTRRTAERAHALPVSKKSVNQKKPKIKKYV
jgi:hypothetical protein